jgi:signal transduction histidine kinase
MPKAQAAEREFRRRFWWAISVPLVLLALLAAVFAFQTSRLNSSLQAMSRSNDILVQMERMRRGVVSVETNAQEFLHSHDPALFQSYRTQQATLPLILRDLDTTLGNNRHITQSVHQAYENWRQQLDQSVQLAATGRDLFLDPRFIQESRLRWSDLLSSMDGALQSEIANRAQTAAAARSFVLHGASFGIGLALVIGILLSLFTRRQLTEISGRYRAAIEATREKAQAAEQALHARDDFFSIASHELKTPVTTIELRLHALQSLLNRIPLPASHRPQVNGAVQSLKRQVHRLSELIENILDVSRINTGQLILERSSTPVSVDDLIRRSVAEAKDILEQSHCHAQLALEPATAKNWDPERIVQAIKALISNSAKYAPNSTIEIRSSRMNDHVQIEVTDHGLGIAPKDHPRVFRLFERGVSSRHYGGFGTGLFITREIIESHDGTIRLLSAEGVGATVIIDLPLFAMKNRAVA